MENKRVRLTLYDGDGNIVREVEGDGVVFYLVQEEKMKNANRNSGIRDFWKIHLFISH